MYKDKTEEISGYKLSDLSKVEAAAEILTKYLKENDLWNYAPWEDPRDMKKESQMFAKGSAFYDVMFNSGKLEEWYEPIYADISLSKNFMNSIGFKTTKDDGQYGEAIEIKTNGNTIINWNRKGKSVTYFGEKLEENIGISIRKDGGTRIAFDGYIFYQNQLKDLLKFTW